MRAGRWLLIIVLLLAGMNGIESSANSTTTAAVQQQTWFAAGYFFDITNDFEDITVFRMFMLLEIGPSEIDDAITQWQIGDLQKEEMRSLILDYLRISEYAGSLDAFRLGEWVSNLEDSVLDMMRASDGDNERLFYESLVLAHVLACQAAGFIDIFSDTISASVLQGLERIVSESAKMDIAGLFMAGDPAEETFWALLELIEHCTSIKNFYGLED
ncbi:hypothetical protein KAH43_01035 [Candidatus Bipolaricaulota bacterium]|nr:hypothetical protein [Candidatus Bipolaricaulota bacterium]